jgi:NTP pyrophosphohydrolases including oxidative damage repair enzymes
MSPQLTEASIAESLHLSYKAGEIASTDGTREMYAGMELVCAAVLVPLVWWKAGWHLVFTRRTESVENHKGQVSFPGGGCEVSESTPEQTALREAGEEIGLDPADVRLLGKLNDVLTITRYRVTPVVGVMPWPYAIRPEPAEVERVFTLPLDWLADSRNWDERSVSHAGSSRSFPVIYYHQYDGEILWGATARMTHNFLSVLGLLGAKGNGSPKSD